MCGITFPRMELAATIPQCDLEFARVYNSCEHRCLPSLLFHVTVVTRYLRTFWPHILRGVRRIRRVRTVRNTEIARNSICHYLERHLHSK